MEQLTFCSQESLGLSPISIYCLDGVQQGPGQKWHQEEVKAPAAASQVIPRVALSKEVPGRGCGKLPSTGSGSSQALFNVFDFSWAALGVLGKSFGVTALEQQVQLSLMVVSPPVPVHQVLPCQGPTPVVERS